ncbi:MAG: phosphoglycerate mutase family protein [Oscillospiraceae bacterium]|nr:phosphoglycerate mutase family protein [Oscillospiraceae bacterium]
MRLLIIRHGDPDYQHDALTELGQKEAQLLAHYLSHRLPPPRRLFASPLGRAWETASYTARALNQEVTLLPWIEEAGVLQYRYAPAQSQAEADQDAAAASPRLHPLGPSVIAWDIPARDLDRLETLGNQWYRDPCLVHPAAEIYLERLQKGLRSFMDGFGIKPAPGNRWSCHEPLPQGDVAIFCHLGSGLLLISALTGLPAPLLWKRVWLAPSSISSLLLEQQEDSRVNVRITQLGATPHLPAELENNHSGLQYNPQ